MERKATQPCPEELGTVSHVVHALLGQDIGPLVRPRMDPKGALDINRGERPLYETQSVSGSFR